MRKASDVSKSTLYALFRLEDRPGNWCWRVCFRRRGKPYYKTFYDLKLGGSDKAFAAAMAWRDAQLARTPSLGKREFHEMVRSTNHSGVPGVQLIRPKNQPLGSWQARLKLPNSKERTRAFSVLKYGDEEAFALAAAARAEFLSEVENTPFLRCPAAMAFEARRLSEETKIPPETA